MIIFLNRYFLTWLIVGGGGTALMTKAQGVGTTLAVIWLIVIAVLAIVWWRHDVSQRKAAKAQADAVNASNAAKAMQYDHEHQPEAQPPQACQS